jgi:hypothetical protein
MTIAQAGAAMLPLLQQLLPLTSHTHTNKPAHNTRNIEHTCAGVGGHAAAAAAAAPTYLSHTQTNQHTIRET